MKVIIDCSAFTTVMDKRELVPRKVRWWLKVQDFDMTLEHRKGSRMEHVDALSRAPIESHVEVDTASMKVLKAEINEGDWLHAMQMQYNELRKTVERINEGDDICKKEYGIENNRLLRRTNDGLLWVVPMPLRWKMVEDHHDNVGHIGVDKTTFT